MAFFSQILLSDTMLEAVIDRISIYLS